MFYKIFSCLLVVTGGVLVFGSSYIFQSILTIGLQLRENSYLADLWSVNPMPLYLEFYAFNWTNPEDFHTPGVKPKFEEIGPFTFKEIREKKNITWNENGTVSYRQYHTYFFKRERSSYDLNLPITTLNPVISSAAYIAKYRNYSFWMRKAMQVIFNQLEEELAVTHSFGHYLFEGYSESLVTLANKLPFMAKTPLDETKFAWFYKRNGTSFEGDFNMGTQYEIIGTLKHWNYQNFTPHYEAECGRLNDTSAGELLPSHRKESISIFIPDMCRSVRFEFEKEETVAGIVGWKYTAGDRFLDNGTLFPENKCFCPGKCLPSGVVNISSCKYNAPGFASLPNFYKADDCYLNGVEGLKPDPAKHEVYYIIEPITRSVLKVALRLQVNLYLEPVQYISMFEHVPEVMFPVMWFQQVAQVPDFVLNILKVTLMIPSILTIAGIVLILIGLYIYTHARKKTKQVC